MNKDSSLKPNSSSFFDLSLVRPTIGSKSEYLDGVKRNYSSAFGCDAFAGQVQDSSFNSKIPRQYEKTRGLRHFSAKVCDKVKEKGHTNYNEVADELVNDYFDSMPESMLNRDKMQYDSKNIRRRVYDALNVLMAMNVIEKERKEIRWVGLPSSSEEESRRIEEDIKIRKEQIHYKKEQLQELIVQLVAYKSLVERNKKREEECGRPPDNQLLYLPYIIICTDKKTTVECAIAPDKTQYYFNFDRPFQIHDDIEVLKRMGYGYGLESGTVKNSDATYVADFIPPALRGYIHQIISGTFITEEETNVTMKPDENNAEISQQSSSNQQHLGAYNPVEEIPFKNSKRSQLVIPQGRRRIPVIVPKRFDLGSEIDSEEHHSKAVSDLGLLSSQNASCRQSRNIKPKLIHPISADEPKKKKLQNKLVEDLQELIEEEELETDGQLCELIDIDDTGAGVPATQSTTHSLRTCARKTRFGGRR